MFVCFHFKERPDSAEPPQMEIVPRHVEVTPDIEVTPEVNPLVGVKGPPQGEHVEKCEYCAFSCKKKNEMYIHCIRMHWRCIACNTVRFFCLFIFDRDFTSWS